MSDIDLADAHRFADATLRDAGRNNLLDRVMLPAYANEREHIQASLTIAAGSC